MTGAFQIRRRRESRLLGYVESLLMVGFATLVGLLVGPWWGTATVVLLYLPPVLAAAVLRGREPAVLAAITSALAYNFFFTAPVRTLIIHSPADAVTVIVLLLAGLLTSRLAGQMREYARRADAHAARNAMIAGFARQLLSCAGEAKIAEVAVTEVARVFGCQAVLLRDAEEPRLIAGTLDDGALGPNDLGAAVLAIGTGAVAGRGVGQANLAEWQFHPIRTGAGVAAVMGLARYDGEPPVETGQLPLLDNLLDQLALAMERDWLEDQTRAFAATRHRDQVRSVLLASIGDDLRPRVDALAASSRALRRDIGTDNVDVSNVVAEVAKLDRYVSNILDLGEDQTAEPVTVGEITVDLHRRVVLRSEAEVHLTPKEYAVLAELVKQRGRVLSHAHLLRSVWGPAQEKNIDYLRVAIRSLRQKLEREASSPRLIINEPGVGYRLAV